MALMLPVEETETSVRRRFVDSYQARNYARYNLMPFFMGKQGEIARLTRSALLPHSITSLVVDRLKEHKSQRRRIE
ncbi:hypothetical protein ABIE89_000484 [Bradyrhizobium niftali]|uniref:hypothetical protein n=1 Tax=Bradyrhizobium niftali TaxID=2560055 RepID=UPI00383796F5